MTTWQVFKGNRFTGITESNYAYACKWWADYTQCNKRNPDKAKYTLRELKPTTKENSMAIATLKEMSTRVKGLEVFKGSSVFSENTGANLYCVYSYGYHFPMYVYDYGIGKWIGNSSKWGVTTSKHQGKCHPNNVLYWLDTEGMKELIQLGGFVQYKTAREIA